MVIISWERGKHKGTGWQRPGAFHPACGQKHALHAPEKQAAAGARRECHGGRKGIDRGSGTGAGGLAGAV